MRYFGSYGVQTIRRVSWTGATGFTVYLYHRRNWIDEIIAGPVNVATEAQALTWAEGEIKKHKDQDKRLRELTRD